jgi:hypothetical protein
MTALQAQHQAELSVFDNRMSQLSLDAAAVLAGMADVG